MSAFAVKVSSDKQTLILAGEAIPPPRANADRGVGGSDMRVPLQRVTMLLVQGDYAATPLTADSGAAKFLAAASERVLLRPVAALDAPAAPAQSLVPYPSVKRALSAGGAAAYARTQNLSGDPTRIQLIDTYA
jgi:hypothetical protein